MASVVRSTALRAGGACVRCRKGKTKCVYENGRSPCKNCAKGMHECYLPSESMSHGGHGVSPARVQQRARESLPSERTVSSTSGDRQAPPPSSVSRHVSTTTEKYVSSFFPLLSAIARIERPFSCVGAWFPMPTSRFPLDFRWLRCQRLFLPRPGYLHPPSSSIFSVGSGVPGSSNFPHPDLISQTGTRNFPLLRAQLPVSPRLSWPWHAPQSPHLHILVMALGLFFPLLSRWAGFAI